MYSSVIIEKQYCLSCFILQTQIHEAFVKDQAAIKFSASL